MAVNLINIGTFANDGTGDDLREAFVKVNQNFEDLDLRNDEQTTATNVGDGITGSDVFKERIGYDLQFRRIRPAPGGRVTVEQIDENIDLNAVGGDWRFITNSGTDVKVDSLADQIVHLKGVPWPETIAPGGVDQVFISYNGDSGEIEFRINPKLKADANPVLGGNLDAAFRDITNVGTVTATTFSGELQGNVWGIDIRQKLAFADPGVFDFGGFSDTVDSIYDWMVSGTEVDFGTFAVPDYRTIDAGPIITT